MTQSVVNVDDPSAADGIADIRPDQVRSAYDGRANRCACGCSGNYYGPGYPEFSIATTDRMVGLILKRMQRRAAKAKAGEVEPLWTFTYSDGSRMFAYQTASRLIRIETVAL